MNCDRTTPVFKPAFRVAHFLLVAGLVLAFSPTALWAVVTGSTSGTARDASATRPSIRTTAGSAAGKYQAITTFTSGTPVQISETDDRSLLDATGNSPQAGSTDEPMFHPGPIYVNRDPRQQYVGKDGVLVNPYFNPALFRLEPLGVQGNASRRFFLGPGLNNWTLALLKDLKLTERMEMEFRGEFFNAFNHVPFGRPNGGLTSGPARSGAVSSAAAPRIAQVGAKIVF